MAHEDALERAEEHLLQSEKAGLNYATPEERGAAKLALAEQFTKQAKQENIGPAAAASESTGAAVVGSVGGSEDLESIEAELEGLRNSGPATGESMKRRRELGQKKRLV